MLSSEPERPVPVRSEAVGRHWLIIVLGLALASGVAVSVIYLPQPLLAYVGAEFGASHAVAAWAATAAQFGYGIGVLLLVPVGEIRSPRRLVRIQFAVTAVIVLICAAAPQLWLLCLILLIAGGAASVAQLLGPLAARLAPTHQRENATALIIAGLALGIFGGRVGAAIIADMTGWRWVFVAAAVALLAMVLVLGVVVGADLRPTTAILYKTLLGSLPGLFARTGTLRAASGYQFLAFSSFNAVWTVAALHLTERLGFTPIETGLFALVGLFSAVLVPFTGTLMRATGHDTVRSMGFAIGAVSSVTLIVSPSHPIVLGAALAGLAVMNFVVQVPNQVSIYDATGDAGPRANAIFIFFTFIGAAIGAEIGAVLYQYGTITATGVFSLGMALLALTALVIAQAFRIRGRRRMCVRRPLPAQIPSANQEPERVDR
ncbi:MFS transporter [Rhodococcus sp. IEGM 1307]|uniref:MFS transporter n=1 Tax=Rhodococcus sp. IEGM 1307 TaxID=3047091 RepID=UPI0024B765D6|nr:MFS transporter [Rhodococcus sp. IEGM 1307]MDI9977217.1 MFS transporter [Rhodococcus sp. IEGM 1307]